VSAHTDLRKTAVVTKIYSDHFILSSEDHSVISHLNDYIVCMCENVNFVVSMYKRQYGLEKYPVFLGHFFLFSIGLYNPLSPNIIR